MAGAARGRGRGRKQTEEARTPTKSARRIKKRVQSSDDEADDPAQIEEVASGTDEPGDEAATPIASRASTRVRKPSMKVKMALDEAEDDEDDAVSDLTQLEEEDEIPDEGEEVGSDIEKIDVSPDYVAFTRPSTSPVRGRKGMTLKTPPTPSPTKNAKKRPAPPSPDATNANDDEDEDEDIQETPVKGRTAGRKKLIKSEALIVDSDIEEVSVSDVKKPIVRGDKKSANKVPAKPLRTSVKTLDKKIVVKGSKFPSTPVEDADNNVFLESESPLPRSPKKKQKVSPVLDSDAEASDEDTSVQKQAPDTPSVSRITQKLHSSALTSAKKPSISAAQKTHLENLRRALGMRSVKDYFCTALINTYGHVRVADQLPVSLCNKDQSLTWFTLRAILTALSIAEGSKQERDIVGLITGPEMASFIYNPARCSIADFHLFQQSKSQREFVVPKATNKKCCFLLFGAVRSTSILETTAMGASGWYNRNICIYPLAVDFVLANNFFKKFYGTKGPLTIRDYLPIGSKPMQPGGDDGSSYKGTDQAPPTSSNSPTIHRLRVDEQDEKLLWEVLGGSIEGGGLEAKDDVPVFDMRDCYGCMSQNDIPHSMDMLVAMCARKPRFEGELPAKSLVGVLCVPVKRGHGDHSDLSFNLVGAILLATPYGTGFA